MSSYFLSDLFLFVYWFSHVFLISARFFLEDRGGSHGIHGTEYLLALLTRLARACLNFSLNDPVWHCFVGQVWDGWFGGLKYAAGLIMYIFWGRVHSASILYIYISTAVFNMFEQPYHRRHPKINVGRFKPFQPCGSASQYWPIHRSYQLSSNRPAL